jgi:IS4 transposase
MNSTPLFSIKFHIQTLSKKRRTTEQKLADEIAKAKTRSLDQLSQCFAKLIPGHLLAQNTSGKHSRSRIFTKQTTFWAFLSQVIDADGGCSEVVSKLRSFAALKCPFKISPLTGAYCTARKNLAKEDLKEIFTHTVKTLDDMEKKAFEGRRVIVVDGTGLTAADTEKNQKKWPQQKQQKPGCGFPSLRVCACFSLKTGGVLSYRTGNKKSHELRLFRDQWDDLFQPGDINLADKMFSSYFDLAMLSARGVDSVVTQAAAKRKPIGEANSIKKLGDNDLLVAWKKPVWHKKAAYLRKEWETLPSTLKLRQIKIDVAASGFRVKSFYIITTLLDPDKYPATDLAELYLRRWEVELNFDDLKTTMGMDELRCKTPEMVEKELLMYFIAYNAARWMIGQAVGPTNADPMRISFKGALQELRNWEGQLNHPRTTLQDKRKLIAELLRGIALKIVSLRPNRKEPRCLKRRPKSYQLLTEHRSTMKEIKHRSKYRAKTP